MPAEMLGVSSGLGSLVLDTRDRMAYGELMAAILFIGGVLPTSGFVHAVSEGHDSLATTLAHFATYAALGYLLAVAIDGREISVRSALWSVGLAAALGGVIELVQGPLPYRDAQVADFVVDVAGAVAGLVALSLSGAVVRRRSRRG